MKRKSTFVLAVLSLLAFLAPAVALGGVKHSDNQWLAKNTHETINEAAPAADLNALADDGESKAITATYKLVQVSSITSGKNYVFYRNNRVLTTVSNKVVNTTTSYKTTGLTGSENYVWRVTSRTSGSISGYVLYNVSASNYMCNTSSTNMATQTSISNASIWGITISSGVALISNKSNDNRFLGDNGSDQYKAYATGNLSSYPHDITIYQLVEEVPTCTANPTSLAFGEVEVNQSSQKTLTVTTADLTSALSLSVSAGYSVSPTTIAKTATSTTVTVTCTPTALGTQNGTLTISGGGLSSNTTVALTATGVCTAPATLLAYDPISLTMTGDDISTVLEPIAGSGNGGSITYTLTTNPEGNGEVDGDTFYAIGTGTYVVTATQAANGIYCGTSVDITIDVLSSEPSCVIDPDIYDFGNVAIGSTNTATFTVTTANLTGDLTVSIDNASFGFSVSPTSIPANATTTTLTVTFAPTEEAHSLTASLFVENGGLEELVLVLIGAQALPTRTVTFSCNGGMATAPAQQTVLDGGSVTLPNPGNLNSDFAFVGWTLDPAYVDDGDIAQAGESVTVTGNETYYAVYSHSVFHPTGRKYYEKVTEDLSDWSGDYLIVYEFYVDWDNGNLYVFDSPYDASAFGKNTYATYAEIFDYYSNQTIEYNETTAAYEITVAKTTNGYSLYDKSSGAYLGYNNSNNGAYLRWDETFTSSQNEWTLSPDDVVSVYNNTKVIRWNEQSPRFAIYASTGIQKPVQLYKYTEAGTTTTARYTRVFLNETADDDIEIVGPSIIPSGNSLNMDEYELVNAYDYEVAGDLERAAANFVIEEGAQLILNTWDVPVTMQKNITAYTGEKDNYYLMALPFDSYSVEGSPFVTVDGNDYVAPQNYDFYTFNGAEPQEEWQVVGTDDAFDPGVGFLYANNVGGTLNLMGTLVPSEEPWQIGLDYDGTKTFGAWNLVGNPFACNAQTDFDNFYVIDGEELAPASTGIVAPLQGIMVQAPEDGASITFSKAGAAKSAKALTVNVGKDNIYKSGVSTGSTTAAIDRAIVRFDESRGLEKFQLNPNHTKIYFQQGNKDYAVVRSVSEGEMPVSFKAEKSGSYTFNIETENVEMEYLHLIDNLTGDDVDLMVNPSYSFKANPSDYPCRFKLVFKACTGVEENASTSSANFAYFNGSEWIVNNEGNATLQVFDMMGRVISSEQINGNTAVNINEAAGIYMLRLVNGENVMVQKVVVRE